MQCRLDDSVEGFHPDANSQMSAAHGVDLLLHLCSVQKPITSNGVDGKRLTLHGFHGFAAVHLLDSAFHMPK